MTIYLGNSVGLMLQLVKWKEKVKVETLRRAGAVTHHSCVAVSRGIKPVVRKAEEG